MKDITPQRWQDIDRIFAAALECEQAERAEFLDEACDGDELLRREVESLLANDIPESLIGDYAVQEATRLLDKGAGDFIPKRIGRYRITRSLGAGGMGRVYLGLDEQLNRAVAVKLLSNYDASEAERMRRFRQEALAASALNHPNILTIYEIGEFEGTNFIIAEFVDGVTLRARIKADVLPLELALDIAIQIASALSAAHAAGIIHRDIKSENVMVRSDGLVKVLDFGIAKFTQADGDEKKDLVKTMTGAIIGTATYMSPEQARGTLVDTRSDIWSLGVILYEMVARRLPFWGDTPADVIAAILERQPPPLPTHDSVALESLERIVLKALQKEKENRYQTAAELLTDLRQLKRSSEFVSEYRADPQQRASELEAGSKAAKPNIPGHPAAKDAEPPGHILSTRRTAIYAAVLVALMLGAFAYVRHWQQTSVAFQPEIKSLAVLPLKSLDAGENYLGLGIADAVIRRINQTGELIVRPTSAVRRYLNEDTDALNAARQLNADAVLEGNVQRADDRLRVSVNLLRTNDGVSLWAEKFDMRMSDIFTIQDAVAQQVATRLRLQLDPSQQARFTKRYTSNPIAYEFYIKGVYSFDQRGYDDKAKPQMEATIDLFKKAIEADPNYALAYAQLAYAYAWTALFIEPTEPAWVERAKEEINRAQALDPQLAETHVARHFILQGAYEGWQTEAAIRELLLAQQLNPNVGHEQLGLLYLHIGLEDLYAREMQRALDVDPTSEYIKRVIINSYVNLNRYDEGLAAQQKFSNGKPDAWYLLGKGRLDDAQTLLEQALAKEPDNLNANRLKAILLALRGDARAAEAGIPFLLSKRSVKAFDYHHLTYDIACIYALAGKSDEAVKWLRETTATGFPCYPLFERDPYLNRIRQAPEFVQFMAEMKSQNEKYKREFA